MSKILNQYYQCLFQQLLKKMNNAIMQQGISDLEDRSYNEMIHKWYDELFQIIESNPPSYFVKILRVSQTSNRQILSIDYYYYELGEKREEVSLNILLF